MKRRLSLLMCGMLAATAIVSSSSVSALAAPKVDPSKPVQAEMTFGSSGVTDVTEGDVRFLAGFEAGDYTRVKDVDFGDGYEVLIANVRAASASLMEVRLDAVDGEKIGSFKVNNTNGSFKEYTTKISGVTGKHEVYFVGKIGSIDFDYWKALAAPGQTTPDPEPTPVVTTVDPYSTVELENADDIVRVAVKSEGNVTFVEGITTGTLVAVKNVEFDGSAAFGLTFRTTEPAIIEVRDGKLAGEKLATLKLNNTNGQFVTDYFAFPDLQGTHSLFFVGTYAKADVDSFIVLKAPVKPNPNPSQDDPDPTPVDPDPTPVDPDPTPVDPDPTPVDPDPIVVDPDPIVVDGNLTAEYSINSWGTGFTVNFKVVNDTDSAVNNWTVKIKKSDLTIDSAWCVKLTTDGDYYVLTPDDWNAAIRPHDGAFFGFQGSGAIGSTIDYVVE